LNIYLFVRTPKGFFPQQDTGRINGLIQGDQDLSFAAMSQKMREFTDIVMQDPAIDSVTAFAGGGNGGSTARMFAQLKPLSERKLSSDQVIGRIRSKTARIPGAALYLQSVQDLSVGGRFGGAQYQYTLQADNLVDLTHWAPIIMQRLQKIPSYVTSIPTSKCMACKVPSSSTATLPAVLASPFRTLTTLSAMPSASARSPTSTKA